MKNLITMIIFLFVIQMTSCFYGRKESILSKENNQLGRDNGIEKKYKIGKIKFLVINSDGQPIKDAKVKKISCNNITEDLGSTNENGYIIINKNDISDAIAIIFCKEEYYCGAFIYPEFLEANVMPICLASYVIIDQIEINPKNE